MNFIDRYYFTEKDPNPERPKILKVNSTDRIHYSINLWKKKLMYCILTVFFSHLSLFQTASGPLTTTQGNVLNVYMSRIYGYYNTAFLKVMANLEKTVISYSHLDPREFIDAAIDHIELKELHMVGCGQFSEFQMIELFCCLPNLEVIDATCTCGILYVSAYVICCNLRKLKMLKVEPKFPFEERFDWAKLQAIFHHINFGKKVYAVVRCAHS